MIRTKKELLHYMEQDRLALRQVQRKHPRFFGDEIWKYTIALRKWEYYSGKGGFNKFFCLFSPGCRSFKDRSGSGFVCQPFGTCSEPDTVNTVVQI